MVRVNVLRVKMGEVITDMMHLAKKKAWNKREKPESQSETRQGDRSREQEEKIPRREECECEKYRERVKSRLITFKHERDNKRNEWTKGRMQS